MFLLTERIFKIFFLSFFDRTTIQRSNTKLQPAMHLLVTAVEIGYPTQAWIMGQPRGPLQQQYFLNTYSIFNVVYLEPLIILDWVKSLTCDRKNLICQCGLLILDQGTLIVYIGPHLQSLPEPEKTPQYLHLAQNVAKKERSIFIIPLCSYTLCIDTKLQPAVMISAEDNLLKGIQGRSRI